MSYLSIKERTRRQTIKIQNEWDEKYIVFIKKHIDKPFNWRNISLSANLTINVIKELEDNLRWDLIVYNINFNLSWIDAFPDKNWDWNEISKNRNFDISWVDKYPVCSKK